MARYIHEHSSRSGGPFFSLNCAAVAPSLAESELFGHERGSFTGAHARKRGLLELAEGGTLLLNEIGELQLPLQAKLLTFLDTRKFTRVGGEREISVNVRLIAATNRDLAKEVAAGTFRQDLLYRLNIMNIIIPPLRDRREDIPDLVKLLVASLATEMQLARPPVIDESMIRILTGDYWPGNIRELRNVLERTWIIGQLPRIIGPRAVSEPADVTHEITLRFDPDRTLPDLMDELTRWSRVQALKSTRGNKRKRRPNVLALPVIRSTDTSSSSGLALNPSRIRTGLNMDEGHEERRGSRGEGRDPHYPFNCLYWWVALSRATRWLLDGPSQPTAKVPDSAKIAPRLWAGPPHVGEFLERGPGKLLYLKKFPREILSSPLPSCGSFKRTVVAPQLPASRGA